MAGKKRRRLSLFAPIMAVIICYFTFVLVSQQVHLGQVAADQAEATARLAAAQQENEALKRERDNLGDPAYIEKIAREELGMTRPGELPYAVGK